MMLWVGIEKDNNEFKWMYEFEIDEEEFRIYSRFSVLKLSIDYYIYF